MKYVHDITVDGTTYQFMTSGVTKARGYTPEQVLESLDFMAMQYRKTLEELATVQKQRDELKNRYEAMRDIACEASTKLAVSNSIGV